MSGHVVVIQVQNFMGEGIKCCPQSCLKKLEKFLIGC